MIGERAVRAEPDTEIDGEHPDQVGNTDECGSIPGAPPSARDLSDQTSSMMTAVKRCP